MSTQEGSEERYEVTWGTTLQLRGWSEPRSVEVSGALIIQAGSESEAREVADDLRDVDFFHPCARFSSSNPKVLGGTVRTGSESGSSLANVLPDLGEFTFERIDVDDVRHIVTV